MTGWRYGCPECGSVVLKPRTRLGGYRCNSCGHVMDADERVDRKVATDGGADVVEPGDGVESPTGLDERDRRALEQILTVLDDVGSVRGAPDLFLVVSESGEQYTVDARDGVCNCADYTYRSDQLGARGCKHLRRVKFATGLRPIPATVDPDDVDEQLGQHVDGEPRWLGEVA